MKNLVLIIFFCCSRKIIAQSDVPLTLRAQFNGSYGYTIIGNTHNSFDNWQLPVPPCQMLTQSTATLNLLSNQTIVSAYLYWSGIGDSTFDNNISLNNINYIANQSSISYPYSFTSFSYFGVFQDVTNQVINSGNSTYIFSDLDLNPLMNAYCSNSIYYGGWSIVVVYSQSGLPSQQINIYDGLNIINSQFNGGITPLTITNLNVIDNQNAKMTYVAYNGSPNLFVGESITLNSNTLSNALNPANNPFNGTNSFTGSITNWNQDIDTFDISSFINNGDTQANLTFNSIAIRTIQTVVTSIRSELPDATAQINQVTGQTVCGNRDLVVDYTVANTNSNAVLPAGVPVSFYANNTLLQTVNTTSSIGVGVSLVLQTTITIPATVPNTFDLRIVVDNSATSTSTIVESNENNNEAVQNITLLGNIIPTTFSLQNTFCQNAVVPILPTISNNSISGTWSPNVINNQVSGTYIFTPTAAVGQCASVFTLNVSITPNVTPTFNIANTFCQNAVVPALPSISNNLVSGTWSPSVINNQVSGSYVFMPAAAGHCASNYNLNVTIQNTSITNENLFICDNSSGINTPVVLNSKLNAGNFNFVWTLNGLPISQISPSISVNQSGNYQLVATSILGGCSQIFNFNVIISLRITADYAVSDDFEQDATIAINATGGSGLYSYSFNNLPFSDNPFYEVQDGGDIIVKIKDNSNCDVIYKTITVWQYPRFFTPNNDGTNDVWGIFTKKKINIDIFDRFGKLIQQIKTGEYWNGTFKQQLMPATDYWFVINYDDNKIYKGHFALKR